MRTAHRIASVAKRQMMAMPSQDDWHDYDDEGEGPYVCDNCQGEGVEMHCCDDLCHGQGYCMFSPPKKNCFGTCYQCKGTGEVT